MAPFALLQFLAVAETPSGDKSGLQGLLLILLVVVLIVLAVGAVWRFTAKRASRTPGRNPEGPGGRS
jgi:flagellar basal body-associated protein FliL